MHPLHLFFALLVYPGFAICFTCALRKPTPLRIFASLAGAWIPFNAAIFYARREPTALVLMSAGLALYYIKKYEPPRWLIVLTLIGVMMFMVGRLL